MQSARALGDVLTGTDDAAALIEASKSGDIATLQALLSQPSGAEIALANPRRIYYQSRSPTDDKPTRQVSSMPLPNYEWAIRKAADNGQAEIVSALFAFAKQHRIKAFDIVDGCRPEIQRAVSRGDVPVFKAYMAAYPKVVGYPLIHGVGPLDVAVAKPRTELVALVLKGGANPQPHNPFLKRYNSYDASLLAKAAGASQPTEALPITELLLKHGLAPAGSGGLHRAAEIGRLDVMRLLIKHGSDVDECLPESLLTSGDKPLLATWTPMHFAASRGQEEAMKLLEEHGARTNVADKDRKVPSQVLQDCRSGVVRDINA